MPRAYLTIDDSPSPDTNRLVDFLSAKKIPAILFARGDFIEKNPRAIEHAIQSGIIIGNHSYAHKPAGEMTPQQWYDDLNLCEHLIEAAYARVGAKRPGKFFRFPYVDRGDGKKIEQIDRETFAENDKTKVLQHYLKEEGFKQPFKNLPAGYPTGAADCLYTYTARDWMLNDKHRGHQPIKTREDLIARAATDKGLKNEGHSHVLLLHDQKGMVDDTIALIEYFSGNGFEFLDFS